MKAISDTTTPLPPQTGQPPLPLKVKEASFILYFLANSLRMSPAASR
jgi:hypothetical protein